MNIVNSHVSTNTQTTCQVGARLVIDVQSGKKKQHYNKNTPGKCGRFKSIPNVHISIKKQKVVPKQK